MIRTRPTVSWINLLAWSLGTALTATASEPVVTSTRARAAPVFTVYIENDIVSGTDENYTNGLKLSWLSADLVAWGQRGWRQTLIEWLPFVNRPEGEKRIGIGFGQNMYTPHDIRARNPDPADHPYGGWLYLEWAFVSKTSRVSDTIAIQTGIVGPYSLAAQTQAAVHRASGVPRAQGWDYQLHHEPGINFVYERRWRRYARSLIHQLDVDLVPHAGASIGNVQTYADAGGTVRFGLNLPSDFGVQLARPGSVGGTPTDDLDPRVALDRNFSLFLFAALDGRAVARDIFLDGNTFRSSRSVTRQPLVADLSIGLGLIAGRWQLTYTQVRRTREFRSQEAAHNDFGSMTLSRAY